jgi:hypothetical protein
MDKATTTSELTSESSSTDVLGWQQTRWGMTADEIIAAVGSHIRKVPREGGDGDSWYSELCIPDVEIGDYPFFVQFQMDKVTGTLRRVVIKHEGELDKEPTGALNTARRVLSERFGKPKREGTSDTLVWAFPTTTIDLSMSNILAQVSVAFNPTSIAPTQTRPAAF